MFLQAEENRTKPNQTIHLSLIWNIKFYWLSWQNENKTKQKSRKNGLVLKLKLIVNLVVGIQMLSEYNFDFKKFKNNHFEQKL